MECLTRQTSKSAPTSAVATSTTPAAAVLVSGSTVVPQSAAGTNAVQNPTAVACTPNVVTIPVPIVSQEDIYTYVSVKGSLHDRTTAVFGLNNDEVVALTKRFENGPTSTVNGIMINAAPMQLINTLSQLGYKVICSTGEAEIVWTMQREV